MWEVLVNWGESETQEYGVIQASNIRQLNNILSKQLIMNDLVYDKDDSVKATTYLITSKKHENFYMMATKYN